MSCGAFVSSAAGSASSSLHHARVPRVSLIFSTASTQRWLALFRLGAIDIVEKALGPDPPYLAVHSTCSKIWWIRTESLLFNISTPEIKQ